MPNEPELFFNGQKVETEAELMELLDASQEAMVQFERDVQTEYGVSADTAAAIVYLRSRSRWTKAKEQELVDRDRAGDPIPLMDVLSGEF